LGVYLNDKNSGGKTATVVVPEDQLSLAIGRDGQNARLAAKLTSWRIDIKSLPEATADVVYKIETDPLYMTIAEQETPALEKIRDLLAKKAENRPLTPEEYDRMTRFVDMVEKRVMTKRAPEKKPEDKHRIDMRKLVKPEAFELNVLDSQLPEHVGYILQENGYHTVGDLIIQMKTNEDDVLKLQGIGPRAMTEIHRLVEMYGVTPAAVEEAPAPASATPEVPQPAPEVPGGFETVKAAPEVEEIAKRVEEEPAVAEEVVITPTSPVQEAAAQGAEAPAAEAAEAGTAEETAPEAEIGQAEAEGEEATFDELFTMRPEVTEATDEEEEEDASGKPTGKKKKTKKGKKHTEVEFDPDAGLTIVHKKHKRNGEEWEW
jgi:transcription termination/antitermination protein NusA